MRLSELTAERYKSLRSLHLQFRPLNVLIGANASGKSNILDTLRFLAEAMRGRDFREPVAARGGLVHLAWKGEQASEITLRTSFDVGDRRIEWRVSLKRQGYEFRARETVHDVAPGDAPRQLVDCVEGSGWWWSEKGKVPLKLPPTACALAAAAADASFAARDVASFVERWGFYDPSPSLLRRASRSNEASILDPFGRNLAARLHTLKATDPQTFERIISATRGVLGVPESIDFRVSDQQDSVYFVQEEKGLEFPVHQVGASSGTLRILALMTALFGHTGSGLIGIEEPENQVHPAALEAFAEYLREATSGVQVVLTTHSPLLLDCLNVPEAVCIVRRTANGTEAQREDDPAAVRSALQESGFSLGEFYETKGFGA